MTYLLGHLLGLSLLGASLRLLSLSTDTRRLSLLFYTYAPMELCLHGHKHAAQEAEQQSGEREHIRSWLWAPFCQKVAKRYDPAPLVSNEELGRIT